MANAIAEVQIKILLIEDSRGDVILFEHLLGPLYGLCTVTNVPRMIDGFKAIDQNHYDLIILDLNLADLDGVANIAAVKAQAPATPVIVYSGRNEASIQREARLVGASGYIVKGETSAASLQNTLSMALAS